MPLLVDPSQEHSAYQELQNVSTCNKPEIRALLLRVMHRPKPEFLLDSRCKPHIVKLAKSRSEIPNAESWKPYCTLTKPVDKASIETRLNREDNKSYSWAHFKKKFKRSGSELVTRWDQMRILKHHNMIPSGTKPLEIPGPSLNRRSSPDKNSGFEVTDSDDDSDSSSSRAEVGEGKEQSVENRGLEGKERWCDMNDESKFATTYKKEKVICIREPSRDDSQELANRREDRLFSITELDEARSYKSTRPELSKQLSPPDEERGEVSVLSISKGGLGYVDRESIVEQNCLFKSLSFHSGEDHEKLRARIIGFIEKNNKTVFPNGRTLEQWLMKGSPGYDTSIRNSERGVSSANEHADSEPAEVQEYLDKLDRDGCAGLNEVMVYAFIKKRGVIVYLMNESSNRGCPMYEVSLSDKEKAKQVAQEKNLGEVLASALAEKTKLERLIADASVDSNQHSDQLKKLLASKASSEKGFAETRQAMTKFTYAMDPVRIVKLRNSYSAIQIS